VAGGQDAAHDNRSGATGVKPPAFGYLAPDNIGDTLEALSSTGAVVLAGGQSLLLELAYRDVRPRVVIDINRIPGLSDIQRDDGSVRIGALVRHRRFEQKQRHPDAVLRLLAMAAPLVAHPPIRARGTFCGSVAWGHPAAEWNAVLTGLAGTVHLASAAGARDVPAVDFFLGDRRTARRPGELVTAVSVPLWPPDSGIGFVEHRRTHASFALVAVAVALTAQSGRLTRAAIGLAGIADTPLVGSAYEAALIGVETARAIDALAAVHPATGDDYRDAVTAELVRRAVARAISDLQHNTGRTDLR
jgi:carbon-monoxide dehydrogenase medium subunit